MSQEQKAEQFIAQAEKTLQKSGLMSMFSGGNKKDDAAELYTKAGNAYKMAKKFRLAGDCFKKVAELKSDVKHEQVSNYITASQCYRKEWPEGALTCLSAAIDGYTDMGRFSQAAKNQMTIAEIYETELVDLDKACAAYSQAADWFQGEDSTSSANKALLKVAFFSAQLEHYEKAVDIYESVGLQAIENNLLKYGAREHFLKAGICSLCSGDTLTARRNAERYIDAFPSFGDTRECKFLLDLITAVEEEDPDDYSSKVAEYDNMTRLDPWMTNLLLRIKKTLTEEESLT